MIRPTDTYGERPKGTLLRVLVKGPHCEPELPLMPLKPKKITFNALESVLCESEEVDWN